MMVFVMILYLVGLNLSDSQGLWCSNSQCESCLQGYLYLSHKCLSICPSRYSQVNNSCTKELEESLFIFTSGIHLPFNSVSAGNFYHPLGLELRDPGKQSPIMTKDRGLYFSDSSSLISNKSWILAPDFRLSLSLRIIRAGVIFQVTKGNLKILEFSGSDSSFSLKLVYFVSGKNITESISAGHSPVWVNIDLMNIQEKTMVTLKFYGITQSFTSYEFRSQFNDLTYSFGTTGGLSFTGFLYDGYLSNAVSSRKYLYFPENYCGFNEYSYKSSCFKCDSSCSQWPWCIRNSCNLCFSQSCSNCKDYFYNSCTNCTTGTAPYCELGFKCLAGSFFKCIECESGYVAIRGICSLFPFKFDEMNLNVPVINTKFIEFQETYDVFQSGNNVSTYNPYNSKDPDDPYLLKSRGMAFTSNKTVYLKSTTSIVLSPEFTLAVWVNIQSPGTLFDKESIRINKHFMALIELSNQEEKQLFVSAPYAYSALSWRFFYINLKTEKNSTTFSSYFGNIILSTITYPGYAFSDQNSTIYIGNYREINFSGMLYSITIWQTRITDLSSISNPCGNGLGASCLPNCNIFSYYSSYEGRCYTCLGSCTQGCHTFGKCSQCSQLNCTQCTSYEINATCLKSVENYCEPSYRKTIKGDCCHLNCADCYGLYHFKCFSCSVNFVMLGSACYSSCPIGYLNISNKCELTTSLVIDVKFNQIKANISSSINAAIYFLAADTSSFYPKFSIRNPIPSKDRGFYFNRNSSMTSPTLNLSYNFTMVLWIRNLMTGIIFKRYGFNLCSDRATAFYNFGSLKMPLPSSWMQIIVTASTDYKGILQLIVSDQTSDVYFTSSPLDRAYADPATFTIGDSSDSFQGFIFRLIYLNEISSGPFTEHLLSSCAFNMIEINNSCVACLESCIYGCSFKDSCNFCADSSCETCMNFSEYSCKKCLNNLLLVNGTCVCSDPTYWNESTKKCENCPELCESCRSPSNCLKCKPNSTLSSFICTCSEGFYLESSFKQQCLSCHRECKTCIGPLKTNCELCKPNALKSSSGICECIEGYFMYEGDCQKCHALCRSCTTLSFCTICKPETLINNGICECPAGKFADLGLGSCKSCPARCLTCLNSECVSCQENASLSNNDCFCNKGFYWDETLSVCMVCHDLCLDCSSRMECFLCKANSEKDSGICSCMNGYFFEKIDKVCLPCHQNCFTCDAAFFNSCTNCTEFSGLQSDYSCKCNIGYFFYYGKCLKCSKYCQVCINSTDCLMCDQYSVLNSGYCSCIEGFFPTSNEDTCQKCHQRCNSCFGEAENNCLTCEINSTLIGSKCFCNLGFFWDYLKGACKECHPLCSSCSSYSICEKCKDNTIKINDFCFCQDGFYLNPSSSECEYCHINCKTCSESAISCSSCKPLFYLSSQKCLCVDGYYLENYNCHPCDKSCKSCTGPLDSNCLSCPSKARLDQDFRCKCSSKFFLSAGICISCYPTCLTCSGSSSKSCITCNEGLIFQETGECKCKKAYFWDLDYQVCILCSDLCLMCGSLNSTECEKCSDHCFICQSNSIYVNGTCRCMEGYYERNGSCFKCHQDCKTCVDSYYFTCSSCSSVIAEGICLENCPLGYSNELGICYLKGIHGEIMNFEFQTYTNQFIDKVSGLEMKSFDMENFQSTLPVNFYGRGIYFNGIDTVSRIDLSQQKKLLLFYEFMISFWINSFEKTGCLIRSTLSNDNITDISISFNQSGISFCVRIGESLILMNSNLIITLGNWSYVSVSLMQNNTLNIQKNFENQINSVNLKERYSGQKDSLVLIGYDKDQATFFKGFIYQIDLRRNFSFSLLVSNICISCSVCPVSGRCLSPCLISQYFEEPHETCLDCKAECVDGCRSNLSCGMCYENSCLKCLDFHKGSCTECTEGHELVDGKCFFCEGQVYYDRLTKSCKGCEGLCSTCLTEYKCLTCKPNSELFGNQCACVLGFSDQGSFCVRIFFQSYLIILLNNSLIIKFSEPLFKPLEKKDIQVFYNQDLSEFELRTLDNSSVSVQFKMFEKIMNVAQVRIDFLNPIISANNSLLLSKNLTGVLFLIPTISKRIAKAKEYASKGATTGASISLCLSIASFDFSSLFNFVNFAEIFSVISLFGLELDEDIQELLRSIRVQKSLPNVFKMISDKDSSAVIDSKFKSYGYESCSILINSGVSIMIFGCLLLSFLFAKISIVMLFKVIPKIIMLKEYFNYGIFSKFWLQTCLDFLITAISTILNTYFMSTFYVFDYLFAVFIIVRVSQVVQVALFAVLVALIRKRSKLIHIEQTQRFDSRFGSIFKEFKSENISDFMFYPLFFLRRLVISLTIHFIKQPIICLAISFCLSLCVIHNQNLFYLLETRCFLSKINNLLHICNEILTSLLHVSIFVILVDTSGKFRGQGNLICTTIITLSWVINILSSICRTFVTWYDKIKKLLNDRKVKQEPKSNTEASKNTEIRIYDIDSSS